MTKTGDFIETNELSDPGKITPPRASLLQVALFLCARDHHEANQRARYHVHRLGATAEVSEHRSPLLLGVVVSVLETLLLRCRLLR